MSGKTPGGLSICDSKTLLYLMAKDASPRHYYGRDGVLPGGYQRRKTKKKRRSQQKTSLCGARGKL